MYEEARRFLRCGRHISVEDVAFSQILVCSLQRPKMNDCKGWPLQCNLAWLWGAYPQREVSIFLAATFCLTVSAAFVASLYILVPLRIRNLQRNDGRQIRWRSLATSLVCVGSMVAYRRIFLDLSNPIEGYIAPRMSFSMVCVKGVFLHVTVLYAGPILRNLIGVYALLQKKFVSVSFGHYCKTFYTIFAERTVSDLVFPRTDSARWIVLRNLVVAPLVEEIAFRACMVSALRSTTLPQGWIPVLAPLFFGLAHAHHALQMYRAGESCRPIIVQTMFQFAYTSMFGAYASFVFLWTSSIAAVFVAHSFCNAMGLPHFDFLLPSSDLYGYRILLMLVHIVGLSGFVFGCCYPDTFFILQSVSTELKT